MDPKGFLTRFLNYIFGLSKKFSLRAHLNTRGYRLLFLSKERSVSHTGSVVTKMRSTSFYSLNLSFGFQIFKFFLDALPLSMLFQDRCDSLIFPAV